jgi:putative membrane protein
VLVISLLNATVGLVLKLLTLPLSLLTLGLFLLVINALMLELASHLVPGFRVESFGAAFVGAVLLAIAHVLMSMVSSSSSN